MASQETTAASAAASGEASADSTVQVARASARTLPEGAKCEDKARNASGGAASKLCGSRAAAWRWSHTRRPAFASFWQRQQSSRRGHRTLRAAAGLGPGRVASPAVKSNTPCPPAVVVKAHRVLVRSRTAAVAGAWPSLLVAGGEGKSLAGEATPSRVGLRRLQVVRTNRESARASDDWSWQGGRGDGSETRLCQHLERVCHSSSIVVPHAAPCLGDGGGRSHRSLASSLSRLGHKHGLFKAVVH